MKRPVFLFALIIATLSMTLNAGAGLYIETPIWQSPWIKVETTDFDDNNDTDQSFDNPHQYIIQVTNGARRFLGVYVDRLYDLNPVMKIDNGINDLLINPAEATASSDNISTWVSTFLGLNEDSTNKSRCYILPVPDDLKPGGEVIFRMDLMGLSAINQLPYDLYGVGAPERAPQLINSAVTTLYHVLLSPLLRTVVGVSAEETEEMAAGLIADIIAHPENINKWINMIVQGDYQGMVADYLKFISSSETSLNILKSHASGKTAVDKLLAGIGKIVDIWNKASDVLDLPYVLAGLGASAWEDEYTIRVVRPQIIEITPNEGEAGDIVAITGKGFDPDHPENNTVYFSWINDNDTLIEAYLPGTIVSTPDLPVTDTTLYVQIPEGFAIGPVEVEVDMLVSNRMVFADNFNTTVEISEPYDGAHLAYDYYTLSATLHDPPENIGDRPPTVRFLIDGSTADEKVTSDTSYSFSLDMTQLTYDVHALKIEVAFDDHAIADTVTVTRVRDLTPYQFGRVKINHVQVFQHVNSDGDTYGDTWLVNDAYGIRCRSTDCQNTFQGTVFNKSWAWSDASSSNVGHIGAVLTADRQKLTSFEFDTLRLSTSGSSVPSTFQTRIQGGNMPLTDWDNWRIQYKVTGTDVCNCLSEMPIQLEHYSYTDSGEKMVDYECNEDSYLEVEFWTIN